MSQEFTSSLKSQILDEATFIRAIFTGVRRGQQHPWQRLVIRPVQIRKRRHLQFSWFDQKQNFVHNYPEAEWLRELDKALELPFASYVVQSTGGDIQVQISKKGKPLIQHHRRASADQPVLQVNLAHDRSKPSLLELETAAPFLKAVGIMTGDGRIRTVMQSKYTQVHEFLRLLDDTGLLHSGQIAEPLHVLDFGCGNAYLTFGLVHYLTTTRGLDARVVGIDTNQQLLENHTTKVQNLGWSDRLRFEVGWIADYQPETPPDVVIALHACDTATDDALAHGIRHGSRVIAAVPCCHHHLQAQLNEQPTPTPFGEVMRYGLMHQRMGDILTDSFRALLLRLAGYSVDVIEFVGTEHTPKNVMLRAIKTGQPGDDPRLRTEYEALKSFWGVTPYLETLL